VLVPLSGGGLAGGIAAAVKVLRPQTRVIGISMERGAAMHASLVAGNPVLVEEVPTLADSLGGGIGLNNRYTFALARDLLDDVLLVSEDAIANAIRHAHADQQEVIEGAAAVGSAAGRRSKATRPGRRCGFRRNIDPKLHRTIIGRMD
jgi:threonine dehydratase